MEKFVAECGLCVMLRQIYQVCIMFNVMEDITSVSELIFCTTDLGSLLSNLNV